ncbi:MAG: sensor histidine kinase, partial [Flavobacterium sp.]
MKKITFIILSLILSVSSVKAQKGINYNHIYSAGGKLGMCLDSAAKNVYYNNIFPNQPNTSFNYLPEVNNLNIQINFRKTDNVQHYRYTILVDDKPLAVNKLIDLAKLNASNLPGGEILRNTTLGTLHIKGKTITTLVYNIKNPLSIEKAIFYGKPIPKAIIKFFSKISEVDGRLASDSDRKERAKFRFSEKDRELVIIKDRSDMDYLYYTSIRDKKINKIIFRSTAWEYGHFVDKNGYLPHVNIDKSVFKKSGDYEIIIQPLIKWKPASKEKEKYTTKHTISITLEERSYSKKEQFLQGFIIAPTLGLIFLIILYFIKKRNKKKLAENE